MRRCAFLVVLFMGLGLLSSTGSAQVEALPGLILTDLQLLSQESLPHWTPAWTGPIQGATIAAWFAEHGYPALIHDLNRDGVVDELDTIELANDFGLGIMQTETPRGTTDVRLVVGLATYFANFYPDEFVLKIYDLGFPTEFAAQGYGTFAPDAIPGIILELKEEPSIQAYIHELSTGEGVIVGLEEGEVDRNRYLAGRSFLSEPTYEGYTPLDFAWAQEDRWKAGHQGQVLETVAKMENRFYLDFQGNWTLVEFMLALSPIEEEADGTAEGCPDLTIRILDESCVYDPKAEAYNITVWAEVLNIGTEPVTAPFIVTLNSTTHPGGAVQVIPVPPLFNPGDVIPITMSFSTPPDPAGAAPCPLTYVIMVDAREQIDECNEDNNTVWGEVCCGDEGDCPDLVVEIIEVGCEVGPIPGAPMSQSVLTVLAKITNDGGAAVVVPTTVLLRGLGPYVMFAATGPVPTLGPGDSHSVLLSFAIPSDEPPCPLDFVLICDVGGDVTECDEDNNTAAGTVCCEGEDLVGACCFADGSCTSAMTAQECEAEGGTEFHAGENCDFVRCPQPDATCPDLTLSLEDIDCDCDPRKQTCEVTITILVSNIGTQAITDPIWLEGSSVGGDSMKIIHTNLDPGESTEVEFVYGTNPNSPCISVTFEVDYIDFIDECDEYNNTLLVVECCD